MEPRQTISTLRRKPNSAMVIGMYETLRLANYFVDRGIKENDPVTLMKLTKLLYFAHGLSLAFYAEPLINEEFEAWKFGPVLRSLYHQAKQYGSDRIRERLEGDFGGDTSPKTLTHRQKHILDTVWKNYGHMPAFQLSAITHESGSPWDVVFNKSIDPGARFAKIPNSVIAEYFQKELGRE
jgi:uncharacterized phage-associated protein